jgi:hypothetical protein
MEIETSILFEEMVYFIADKLSYEVKINEFTVYFYLEEYDKYLGLMNTEYIFQFSYDSTKNFKCYDFKSDITNKRVAHNNYEDFLLDVYNLFKK